MQNQSLNISICSQLAARQTVLLTHGDSINTVGTGLKVAAISGNQIVAAIYNEPLRIYGVQFHPEVDLTVNGKQMLANFCMQICDLKPNFTMSCRKEGCIRYIREKVGQQKVLVSTVSSKTGYIPMRIYSKTQHPPPEQLLVSGGVDSSVCAALLRVALDPGQVIAVHIDNGFMRHNESAQVEQSLRAVGIDVIVRDCFQAFFMGSTTVRKPDSLFNSETPLLCYAINPEEKRKIIGDTFVKVSNQIVHELQLDPSQVVLAQGTLRPDLIESASATVSKNADTIKTHHNDTELVRQLRDAGKVVEPLKDFHKDEVRAIGYELGLPPVLVQRHPFPGPGLAIRILCAEEPFIEKDFAETQVIVRVIVDYYNKAEKNHALLTRVQSATSDAEKVELVRISQSMQISATILPIRSVGVQGDGRTYSYVVGLSTDQPPNWMDMMFLAKLIPRILHNINRVCFVFGPHVVHQVTDVTPTRISRFSIAQLRQADHVANEVSVCGVCECGRGLVD